MEKKQKRGLSTSDRQVSVKLSIRSDRPEKQFTESVDRLRELEETSPDLDFRVTCHPPRADLEGTHVDAEIVEDFREYSRSDANLNPYFRVREENCSFTGGCQSILTSPTAYLKITSQDTEDIIYPCREEDEAQDIQDGVRTLETSLKGGNREVEVGTPR